MNDESEYRYNFGTGEAMGRCLSHGTFQAMDSPSPPPEEYKNLMNSPNIPSEFKQGLAQGFQSAQQAMIAIKQEVAAHKALHSPQPAPSSITYEVGWKQGYYAVKRDPNCSQIWEEGQKPRNSEHLTGLYQGAIKAAQEYREQVANEKQAEAQTLTEKLRQQGAKIKQRDQGRSQNRDENEREL